MASGTGPRFESNVLMKRIDIPHGFLPALVALPLSLGFAPAAAAQSVSGCTSSWLPTNGPFQGVQGEVYSILAFDDGSGTALYIGGQFIEASGGTALHIARWNGATWSPVGAGVGAASTGENVRKLAAFDDGAGAALYAAGSFTNGSGAPRNIAKWDGTSWTALPALNGAVWDLEVFDDGSGPALYAAGSFTSAGGVPASRIARWDGTSWSAVGTGMAGGPPGVHVYALAAFDPGTGPKLYAGGLFSSAGGAPAAQLAAWDGSSWTAVGSGASDTIATLETLDVQGQTLLYAGGLFTQIGGVTAKRIASFDGTAWSPLGGGADNWVYAIEARNEGGTDVVYAAGAFDFAGGIACEGVARWDGGAWSALGAGGSDAVWALRDHDDGNGSRLLIGGGVSIAGVVVRGIASWDGSRVVGLGNGWNGRITELHVSDVGGTPALYAGGYFTRLGAQELLHLARWDGADWSDVGGGLVLSSSSGTVVSAMSTFDFGSGKALYVGGSFVEAGGVAASNVAKWDGVAWSALGLGIDGPVNALEIFDDGGGPALYAAGNFTQAGGSNARNVAKWNGTSWSKLGTGTSGAVVALRAFNSGGGPLLYAGGSFALASGTPAAGLATWNGSAWAALSAPTDSFTNVRALERRGSGSGEVLLVGGSVNLPGGPNPRHLLQWDGTAWSSLGNGPNSLVTDIEVRDEGGAAPVVYVSGYFTMADGLPADGLARWDGTSWSGLGSSFNGAPDAIEHFDDGSGAALWVGGTFGSDAAGNAALAKYGCPLTSQGQAYCTAGTTTNGCVPWISGAGTASASAGSGFTISVAELEGQKSGLLFYGVSGAKVDPWGTGSSTLCVRAPTQRMNTQGSGGTAGACDGSLAQDWNVYVAAHASALGQPFVGGETVWAQAWFRDPPAPKTTNLSDGLVFLVAP